MPPKRKPEYDPVAPPRWFEPDTEPEEDPDFYYNQKREERYE